ncbi:MAG: cytochrome c3 family protein [Acidobacteriota bacterium]
MATKPRARKGTFGDAALPVAGAYLTPRRRRGLVWLGLALGGALLAWAVLDFFAFGGGFVSGGPLSSGHAMLQNDCAACHSTPSAGDLALGGTGEVTDANCGTCHERLGDELGVYSFASHYLYRSGDFQRLVPSEHEMPCSACHVEHQGRQAVITQVADARCQTCHTFGSFGDGHPQFDVLAEGRTDRAGLHFAHGQHVKEVMERQALVDLEVACLHCHQPEADGRQFQPISFDRHCDACHLTATETTPRLPVGPAGAAEPGVATLAQIRDGGAPGTDWALFANPREFREVGDLVSKSPLHHRDPWVMENLRRLRRVLYPNAGLADLLDASAEVPAEQLPDLYREMVATLEAYVRGLRSDPSPAVQDEIANLEEILRQVRRALDDPYTPLDETELLLGLERPADLDPDQRAEIESLVADLTSVCATCHPVERATFARVDTDLRELRRAEFDHRAHVVQRRCLDCHGEIPVTAALEGGTLTEAQDHSGIHNLPAIESCQSCHAPKLANDSCVTCHQFHPDDGRRSQLLLYLDPEEATP